MVIIFFHLSETSEEQTGNTGWKHSDYGLFYWFLSHIGNWKRYPKTIMLNWGQIPTKHYCFATSTSSWNETNKQTKQQLNCINNAQSRVAIFKDYNPTKDFALLRTRVCTKWSTLHLPPEADASLKVVGRSTIVTYHRFKDAHFRSAEEFTL